MNQKREHVYIDIFSCMGLMKERNTGIEPASQAWEAHALPMC
jgi:hypothetical protein